MGDLLVALKPYKVKILSLQYGDDHKIVQKAASKFGVDFVDDEDVQATNDMDNWLDQVNACDGVVSIANNNSWSWYFKYTNIVPLQFQVLIGDG